MDVIIPITIDSSVLVDCNLEDEAPAYEAVTEYKKGDTVSYLGTLYEDAVGMDTTNIPAFDLLTEYMTGDQVKVAADFAVYEALRGAIPANFDTYSTSGMYVAGNYTSVLSTKGVYLCKKGENPANFSEWNSSTNYLVDAYVKVTPTYALKNGNIANQTRIYKAKRGSGTDANTDKSPPLNITGVNPYWELSGVCNVNCPPDTSILYTEWDSATTYPVDSVVKLTASGAAFVALIENTNAKPSLNLIGSSPKWKRIEGFDCNRIDPNFLWEKTDTLNVGIDPATNIKEAKELCWKKVGIYNINMLPSLNTYVAATSDSDAIGVWYVNGSTNTYRMLDNVVDTYSSRAESIQFSLLSDFYDTIALFNIDALECQIVVTNTETNEVLYDEIVETITNQYTDWYDIFNQYPETKGSVLRTLPSGPNSKITVTLSKPSGTVKLGHLSLGYSHHIGKTLFPLEKTINDYSKVTIDDFGRMTLSKGTYAFKSDVQILLDIGTETAIESLLAELRATPCVWRMDNEDIYTGLTQDLYITFAKYDSFALTVERHDYVRANLTLLSIA